MTGFSANFHDFRYIKIGYKDYLYNNKKTILTNEWRSYEYEQRQKRESRAS